MANEIELKLVLQPEQRQRLLRHSLLKQGVLLKRQEVFNVYYDTPDQDLHRHGIALRVRRQGDLWLQTIKCAGQSGGGLSTRPEWETPYSGQFDFSGITDKKVRRYLQEPVLLRRLQPCFETTFQRTTWRFEQAPGKAVLMMLDRGAVKAAGREEVISEVELELDGGDVAHLFALAEGLAQRISLTPALLSKAERGYRLAAGAADEPRRAAPLMLAPGLTPIAAFRLIALACLEHLLYNQQGVADDLDPEFTHQMRIAVRRLQAALRLFTPYLNPQLHSLLPPLRHLMTALGQVRDRDVLLAETLLPVAKDCTEDKALTQLIEKLRQQRQDAQQNLQDLLLSPGYGLFLLASLRALHDIEAEDKTPLPEAALLPFALLRLTRLRKLVTRRAQVAKPDVPESLHSLRIAIKRLRYSLEFFSPLLKKQSRRALKQALTRHQEKLGVLNDFSMAEAQLKNLAQGSRGLTGAVRRVHGWHEAKRLALLEKVAGDLLHLADLPIIKLRSKPDPSR